MKPEILAPGGSFSSAYYAFDAGADAVYLGLQDYSARKKAVNFSLDEIRRLKGAWPDKKLYLALNTLLKDQDLEALLPQLPALLDLPLEAIILQDYGLASFLKNIISQGGASGPALHASTQMAVHSVQGAKFLQSQGFSRVVLARELRLPEIKEIRKALPDLELEVFVLGANCYGFSGLCLASGLFLGRSANRGECGQVCRTWFSAEGSRAPVPQGYWFSLGDRMDEAWIRDLSDLGIQSLKIEGRMKSPAYVQGAVRFCRQALGHLEEVQEGQKTGGSEPPEQALRRIFFRGSEGDRRVNPRYPGATGEPFLRVGIQDGDAYRYSEIQNTGEKSFPIKDSKTPLPPLQQRDGLLVLREEGGLLKGRPFSAKLDPRGYLIAPFPLIEGETVYRSRTEADRLPEIKAERFPLWKKPLGGQLSYLGGELRLNLPGFVFSASLKAEVPRNVGGMLQTLRKILRQSGEYPWVLDDLVVQDLELQGQRVPELYFSPKDLKAFRRDFYRALEDYQEERGRKSLAAYEAQDPLPQQLLGEFLKERPRWVFGQRGLPFLSLSALDQLLKGEAPGFTLYRDRQVLILPPVCFDESRFEGRLGDFVRENPGPFLIGLNNLAHLSWAQNWLLENTLRDKLAFFLDYGLYLTNRLSWSAYRALLGDHLLGGLPWVEENPGAFSAPLFIGRTCLLSEENGGRCPGSCPQSTERYLSQGKKRLRLVVEDCLNYLFWEK